MPMEDACDEMPAETVREGPSEADGAGSEKKARTRNPSRADVFFNSLTVHQSNLLMAVLLGINVFLVLFFFLIITRSYQEHYFSLFFIPAFIVCSYLFGGFSLRTREKHSSLLFLDAVSVFFVIVSCINLDKIMFTDYPAGRWELAYNIVILAVFLLSINRRGQGYYYVPPVAFAATFVTYFEVSDWALGAAMLSLAIGSLCAYCSFDHHWYYGTGRIRGDVGSFYHAPHPFVRRYNHFRSQLRRSWHRLGVDDWPVEWVSGVHPMEEEAYRRAVSIMEKKM